MHPSWGRDRGKESQADSLLSTEPDSVSRPRDHDLGWNQESSTYLAEPPSCPPSLPLPPRPLGGLCFLNVFGIYPLFLCLQPHCLFYWEMITELSLGSPYLLLVPRRSFLHIVATAIFPEHVWPCHSSVWVPWFLDKVPKWPSSPYLSSFISFRTLYDSGPLTFT